MDTDAIEAIVRRIMEEPKQAIICPEKETAKNEPQRIKPKTESIRFNEASELLDEDGVAAIAKAMALFRKQFVKM